MDQDEFRDRPVAVEAIETVAALLEQLTQAIIAQVGASQALAEAVEQLAKPRRSTPVRGRNGDILYVIEQQENEP